MTRRKRTYREESPLAGLVLRDQLGFKKYRKTRVRNEEERKILIDLALKKITEKEKSDFLPVGYKRRRVTC
ncbi:MAG: hypothetical protein QHH14_12440 [Clostridiales bacterium]|nr:hypothetical protein [Clostridiales bacterium]